MKKAVITAVLAAVFTGATAQISLDECQHLARENYPLIHQYGLIEKSADYSISNAQKAYLPQVTLALQATYQSDVASFPERLMSLYQQAGVDMKGLNRDQYKMALEVNQLIWDGGLTKAGERVSQEESNVAIQSVEKDMYALRERINQLYFGILILGEQAHQNDVLQELLQSNYAAVDALVSNGVALAGDLNAIRVEQLTTYQQRRQIESMSKAYRQMLSVMTGREIGDSTLFEKPAAALSADSEIDRPELRLFDAQTALYDAQKRSILASTMPRLGLFAQGFYGNPGLNLFKDMTENRWTWNYIAGVRLSWNLGSFYTKDGNLRKLSLAQQRVDNQKEIFVFNTRLQQIQQQTAIDKMSRIMADDDEIIRLRTSIRKASEAKYSNGTITVSDLLRDISAENQAALNKSIHEIEWLKNVYELKTTINR
ncbi:MAG: TolC family protein [Tannerella sp.]|jgi:outer membrane protein TolC|nr:TolC family protein [Tannerella sp.]